MEPPATSPIVDYVVIRSKGAGTLSDDVRTKLEEGWTLHGSMVIDQEGRYCQPMVLQSHRARGKLGKDRSMDYTAPELNDMGALDER